MLLPQLSSNSSMQFELRRSVVAYESRNRLAGGSHIRGLNVRRPKRVWDVSYRGLSETEYVALGEFQIAVEDAGGEFTFLDPFSNLLTCSEDLTSVWWQRGPWITVIETAPPEAWSGRVHTVTNAGNATEAVSQELGIAGSGTLCASGRFRTNSLNAGRIAVSCEGTSFSAPIRSDGNWARVHATASIASQATPLTLSMEVEPGCTIDIKDLQLEHQAFPSCYKPTKTSGGVYPEASIVYGSTQILQHGPKWFDYSFRIEA